MALMICILLTRYSRELNTYLLLNTESCLFCEVKEVRINQRFLRHINKYYKTLEQLLYSVGK